MGATGKRRVGMTAAVIIAALAVCIAAALAWYVGNSRHGEERDLSESSRCWLRWRSGLAWKFRLRARQPAR